METNVISQNVWIGMLHILALLIGFSVSYTKRLNANTDKVIIPQYTEKTIMYTESGISVLLEPGITVLGKLKN